MTTRCLWCVVAVAVAEQQLCYKMHGSSATRNMTLPTAPSKTPKTRFQLKFYQGKNSLRRVKITALLEDRNSAQELAFAWCGFLMAFYFAVATTTPSRSSFYPTWGVPSAPQPPVTRVRGDGRPSK